MAPQPHSPRTQSPLTRGKHPAWILRVIASRLIPAHAGKTRACGCGCRRARAHPRSRGENGVSPIADDCGPGSSPLTRGKPHEAWTRTLEARLIPAHAGKTTSRPSPIRPTPAHPRSRGENSARALTVSCQTGSSPLTRGKLSRRVCAPSEYRLIPAHAGKTRRTRPPSLTRRAHPRSRGENCLSSNPKRLCRGSSPLTRGKRKDFPRRIGGGRLIPAHAGKTWCESRCKRRRWAHPRSRGENGGRVAGLRGVRGSSPLTRGKPMRSCGVTLSRRLIPAHAGKTSGFRGRYPLGRAHPRSRGENSAKVASHFKVSGSSPLTRGKR